MQLHCVFSKQQVIVAGCCWLLPANACGVKRNWMLRMLCVANIFCDMLPHASCHMLHMPHATCCTCCCTCISCNSVKCDFASVAFGVAFDLRLRNRTSSRPTSHSQSIANENQTKSCSTHTLTQGQTRMEKFSKECVAQNAWFVWVSNCATLNTSLWVPLPMFITTTISVDLSGAECLNYNCLHQRTKRKDKSNTLNFYQNFPKFFQNIIKFKMLCCGLMREVEGFPYKLIVTVAGQSKGRKNA